MLGSCLMCFCAQVHELQNNIERFQREGQDHDTQRQATLQQLETRLSTSTQQGKLFEAQHTQAADQLVGLKKGITKIFESPVCETTVLADVLGNSEVTEANVMSFLGAIEQVGFETVADVAHAAESKLLPLLSAWEWKGMRCSLPRLLPHCLVCAVLEDQRAAAAASLAGSEGARQVGGKRGSYARRVRQRDRL